MKDTNYRLFFLIFTITFLYNCIEPIAFDLDTFEDILVVEGTITDELKFQNIRLSRTFEFDALSPNSEDNAEVKIIDSDGTIYNFEESVSGNYISTVEFAANPNVSYELSITTNDGKIYKSSKETLPESSSQIEQVNFVDEVDENGNIGISVYVDSFDPNNNSRYYRYEYEETYKIIAPFWNNLDLIAVSTTEIGFIPRDSNDVCYKTDYSTGIIQAETTGLSENRITQKLVKFLNVDNFAISHRYSILVKQYVQSVKSYSYYDTLNKLSTSENVLSENQPGFIQGNIVSLSNFNEKVIGFFDVSPVVTKRAFFSFRDFYPVRPRPPFLINCDVAAPRIDENNNALIRLIESGLFIYYRPNFIMGDPPVIPSGGPHVLVTAECGDCTLIGTNTVPPFWED